MNKLSNALFADQLTDWVVVTLQGPDSEKYLQGQCTLDLHTLSIEQHQLTAHCEAKGKVWSTLRLFRYQDGFAYLLRRSVAEQQITQLKKYAVFAKVNIALAQSLQLIAITGSQLSHFLATKLTNAQFNHQHTLWQDKAGYWLYFATPQPRLLLISDWSTEQLLQHYAINIEQDNQRWLAAEIAAGLPVIDLPNSEQFIPQALNLQALQAIDFQKGCYTGQEMVARAKYRGANKRALYCLHGNGQGPINAGDELAIRLGENWRKTGTVLAACPVTEQQWLIQAVLPNDLDENPSLRLANDPQSQLTVIPLPYAITD